MMNQPTLTRLPEMACNNCQGHGLQLEAEHTAHCRFCNEASTFAGPICAQCLSVNAPGAKICAACNLALYLNCPKCGHRNWTGLEACPACGQKSDALGAVIERAGDTGLRYTERQKQLGAAAAEAQAGSQQRMAYFNDLERQRQDALAASRARQAQEQRVALTITFAIVGVIVLGVVVVAVISAMR